MPINNLVYWDIIFDDGEVDYEKIDQYKGEKVILVPVYDFPHIFMTESQIESNNDYLTKIIDELLKVIGLNTDLTRNELAKFFGEPF